jgi:hypothetical protein
MADPSLPEALSEFERVLNLSPSLKEWTDGQITNPLTQQYKTYQLLLTQSHLLPFAILNTHFNITSLDPSPTPIIRLTAQGLDQARLLQMTLQKFYSSNLFDRSPLTNPYFIFCSFPSLFRHFATDRWCSFASAFISESDPAPNPIVHDKCDLVASFILNYTPFQERVLQIFSNNPNLAIAFRIGATRLTCHHCSLFRRLPDAARPHIADIVRNHLIASWEYIPLAHGISDESTSEELGKALSEGIEVGYSAPISTIFDDVLYLSYDDMEILERLTGVDLKIQRTVNGLIAEGGKGRRGIE